MATVINFNGSIPQYYEDYLTEFLFDGFAADLVKRVVLFDAANVLELASGTGCVTQKLLDRLPPEAHLTATDLQAGMLDVAKKNISASNVTWATVDMTSIPYEDDRFDVVVCQFGVMLVPEKVTAFREMRRVLKPGGQLVFNVWGNIHDNPVWAIGSSVIGSFLENNPILQDPGPFSLNESNTVQLLNEAGFSDVRSTVVSLPGSIDTAARAAKGFIEGLPVVLAISKSDPALIPKIQQKLEEELIRGLGDHPLRSSLNAFVFETYKR